jgi:hypothetical protein
MGISANVNNETASMRADESAAFRWAASRDCNRRGRGLKVPARRATARLGIVVKSAGDDDQLITFDGVD